MVDSEDSEVSEDVVTDGASDELSELSDRGSAVVSTVDLSDVVSVFFSFPLHPERSDPDIQSARRSDVNRFTNIPP